MKSYVTEKLAINSTDHYYLHQSEGSVDYPYSISF